MPIANLNNYKKMSLNKNVNKKNSYKETGVSWTYPSHTMIPVTNWNVQTIKMIKFFTIMAVHQSSLQNTSFA